MGLKYFEYEEFDDKSLKGSWVNMSRDFLQLLDKIRGEAKVSMVITSAYRTEATNNRIYKEMGKPPIKSSHLQGLAVDVKATDSNTRQKILTAAIKNGITRIGIGANFLHLDCDTSKPDAVWHYY